jgi:hypothetical protein
MSADDITPSVPSELWSVEVKDIVILATRQGADWWFLYRRRFEDIGRITVIPGTSTPQGDHCLVACDSREDAEWLAGHMVAFGGVPRTAVRARRTPAGVTA